MITDNIYNGDSLEVLKTFEAETIDCVVTSPPYWALRDYGVEGQLGLEKTFQEYINKLCNIFDEVKRVLKPDGTCWVNIGDTYSGTSAGNKEWGNGVGNNRHYAESAPKDKHNQDNISEKSLCQIPSRFAIEMTNRGWILRNEIIWHKPNIMPQSVKDRFTVDFEKIFFFVKNKQYYFNQLFDKCIDPGSYKTRNIYKGTMADIDLKHSGINNKDKIRPIYKERNKRAVWTINTKSYNESHFATYPEALVMPMLQAGCPPGGVVLDPFFGAGTTGLVAKKLNMLYVGIELNKYYINIAEKRILRYTSQLKLEL